MLYFSHLILFHYLSPRDKKGKKSMKVFFIYSKKKLVYNDIFPLKNKMNMNVLVISILT